MNCAQAENPYEGAFLVQNTDKCLSIYHILPDHGRCFQHSGVYEKGQSGFHKLTLL